MMHQQQSKKSMNSKNNFASPPRKRLRLEEGRSRQLTEEEDCLRIIATPRLSTTISIISTNEGTLSNKPIQSDIEDFSSAFSISSASNLTSASGKISAILSFNNSNHDTSLTNLQSIVNQQCSSLNQNVWMDSQQLVDQQSHSNGELIKHYNNLMSKESINKVPLFTSIPSLSWVLESIDIIHEVVGIFTQPLQMSNQMLLHLYNRLIDITVQWLEIDLIQDRVVASGADHLLSLLKSKGAESFSNKNIVLDLDRIVEVYDSLPPPLTGKWLKGHWINPKFAACIMQRTSLEINQLKSSLLHQHPYEKPLHGNLDGYMFVYQNIDDRHVTVLGVISMVIDIFNEMWSRVQKIIQNSAETNALIQETQTLFSFCSSILTSTNLTLCSAHALSTEIQPSAFAAPINIKDSKLQCAESVMLMHVPALFDEIEKILRFAKLPSNFSYGVEEVLTRMQKAEEETQIQRKPIEFNEFKAELTRLVDIGFLDEGNQRRQDERNQRQQDEENLRQDEESQRQDEESQRQDEENQDDGIPGKKTPVKSIQDKTTQNEDLDSWSQVDDDSDDSSDFECPERKKKEAGGERKRVSQKVSFSPKIKTKAGSQGISYNPHSGFWRAYISSKGKGQNRYFSASTYGYEKAKQLASLCRQQGVQTGNLPSKEEVVAIYNSMEAGEENEKQYLSSDCSNFEEQSSLENKGVVQYSGNEDCNDPIGPVTTSLLYDEASHIIQQGNNKSEQERKENDEVSLVYSRFTPTSYSSSSQNLAEDGASRYQTRASTLESPIKHDFTFVSNNNQISRSPSTISGVPGVTFNRYSKTWDAKRPGSIVTFSTKTFSFEGAKDRALFARDLFTKTRKVHTKSQILEMFDSKIDEVQKKLGILKKGEVYPQNGKQALKQISTTLFDSLAIDTIEDFAQNDLNSSTILRNDKTSQIGDTNKLFNDISQQNSNQDGCWKPEELQTITHNEVDQDIHATIENLAQCMNDEDEDQLMVGVNFDRGNNQWLGRWRSGQGTMQSLSFSVNKYGKEGAKQLAIITRKEAEKKRRLPTREYVLKVYQNSQKTIKKEVICKSRDNDNKNCNYNGFNEGSMNASSFSINCNLNSSTDDFLSEHLIGLLSESLFSDEYQSNFRNHMVQESCCNKINKQKAEDEYLNSSSQFKKEIPLFSSRPTDIEKNDENKQTFHVLNDHDNKLFSSNNLEINVDQMPTDTVLLKPSGNDKSSLEENLIYSNVDMHINSPVTKFSSDEVSNSNSTDCAIVATSSIPSGVSSTLSM